MHHAMVVVVEGVGEPLSLVRVSLVWFVRLVPLDQEEDFVNDEKILRGSRWLVRAPVLDGCRWRHFVG